MSYNKYGQEIGQSNGLDLKEFKQTQARLRRSDMRAAIAVAMYRHNIDSDTIDSIMNDAYHFNMYCRENGISVYNVMQQETGLNKI